MSEEKLLTVRDVSILLGLTEKEVMDLSERGTLPAYKVGGVYLRFKREQVLEFKKHNDLNLSKGVSPRHYPLRDKLNDFFYFNDFYILTTLIIILLLVIILRGF